MPKLKAESHHLVDVEVTLRRHRELDHLRARRRADLITIESGPVDDPFPHARLRHVTKQYWQLEMPIHTGHWEKTPLRGTLTEAIDALIEDFPWMLQPIFNPDRT